MVSRYPRRSQSHAAPSATSETAVRQRQPADATTSRKSLGIPSTFAKSEPRGRDRLASHLLPASPSRLEPLNWLATALHRPLGDRCPIAKAPEDLSSGAQHKCLAVSYFHKRNAHYHRRYVVSRSCSKWEGVGPTRYGHQA